MAAQRGTMPLSTSYSPSSLVPEQCRPNCLTSCGPSCSHWVQHLSRLQGSFSRLTVIDPPSRSKRQLPAYSRCSLQTLERGRVIQISVHQTALWSMLHFSRPMHIERATEFIARIGQSPRLVDLLVETVAQEEHAPGVTLCTTEFHAVMDLIAPLVARWRSFHLKIRDIDCKTIARQRLSSCGPAPNLETLQLYHFENFESPESLERATVRRPVRIFEGCLPKLKNISLIGVNLAWDGASAYLCNLVHLEFALHRESVRPTYKQWETILNSCQQSLASLSLHYSGPRIALESASGPSVGDGGDLSSTASKIDLPCLQSLSLTDLDAPWLCLVFDRLLIPEVTTIYLDLPEGDFTSFVFLLAGDQQSTPNDNASSSISPPPPSTLMFPRLEHLTIIAIGCTLESWRSLLTSIPSLQTLDVDFDGIGVRETETADEQEEAEETSAGLNREGFFEALLLAEAPVVVPRLSSITLSGVTGAEVLRFFDYRREKECQISSWALRWCEKWMGRDEVLDKLVKSGFEEEGVLLRAFERGIDVAEDDDESSDGDDVEE